MASRALYSFTAHSITFVQTHARSEGQGSREVQAVWSTWEMWCCNLKAVELGEGSRRRTRRTRFADSSCLECTPCYLYQSMESILRFLPQSQVLICAIIPTPVPLQHKLLVYPLGSRAWQHRRGHCAGYESDLHTYKLQSSTICCSLECLLYSLHTTYWQPLRSPRHLRSQIWLGLVRCSFLVQSSM